MDRNDRDWDMPTDVLVEILVRLPPNGRRRFRLVSQHWRELIDQRTTTDMRKRSKIIAVAKEGLMKVVDLLTPESARDLFWQKDHDTARRYSMMSIVGTCNGLVCLCDDLTLGGAITVANPTTNETLCLPPLPMPSVAVDLNNNGSRSWHLTYGFAYHHASRRYKVVHVPCHFDRFWQPDVVHVFTLGEASWREVHAADSNVRCNLDRSNLVSVDDMVYWLTEDPGTIMSIDLQHEHVTCIEPLLPVPAMPSTYSLAKVHGRLSVAICDYDYDSVTVWVLESDSWSRRYVLEAHKPRLIEKWRMRREVVGPNLVHGDYFLALTSEITKAPFVLCRHPMSEAMSPQDGVVQIRHRDKGEKVLCLSYDISQTFVFVETSEEPLQCGFRT